jgi:CHAT domain-containing protein
MLGGTALVGQDATVEQLETSRDAALLHLAVHAEVDVAGASLLLANQRQVTVADIVEHEIGPRVAVLAGCATAVSRDAEGWGSLSSAFLAAGSRSVVATLQSVKDSDALEIMRRFYARGGDRQPAIALAKAQRELLAADPSAWAPFVVYGSADVDECETSP